MKSNENATKLRELIRALVRCLGILEKDEASCCGVTIAQCHAIVEIGRSKCVSINDLATWLNLDKSTVSRMVNNLVKLNLVERKTSDTDRRFASVELSTKGAEVFSTIDKNMNVYCSNILNLLSNEKKDQILDSLTVLIQAIKLNDAIKGSCNCGT